LYAGIRVSSFVFLEHYAVVPKDSLINTHLSFRLKGEIFQVPDVTHGQAKKDFSLRSK